MPLRFIQAYVGSSKKMNTTSRVSRWCTMTIESTTTISGSSLAIRSRRDPKYATRDDQVSICPLLIGDIASKGWGGMLLPLLAKKTSGVGQVMSEKVEYLFLRKPLTLSSLVNANEIPLVDRLSFLRWPPTCLSALPIPGFSILLNTTINIAV